ncbi:uncharacterized protein N7484_008895 [Penicillium longicatenatum]|uniref:uncharacterized protein n=1 Tax=Penicillium longicatenatum TaxID=1561947 RepID=UPI002548A36D|nr:uncharacterized protein N7484_008895 [Penicillium longicatenatum]KAJ5635582.1 hypothetical protein N7484_008895 [Penicillium longicatenatum]
MASDSAATTRRIWSKLEDERLISLVQHLSDQGKEGGSWNEISRHLPGRSNKDCRKRWFHSLDPALRKGRWSKEEDELLLAAHKRLGPAWKEIALLIDGRKDDQCAKRYNDILNPSVRDRLRNWTPEEDQYLAAKVQELGHKWAAISAGLPGRPPLTCRNRWRRLSKDLLRNSDSTSNEPRSTAPATVSSTASRSNSISHLNNMSYPMAAGSLTNIQSFDMPSANLSLAFQDPTLQMPIYGMDNMSIHSASVYGVDNMSTHSTQNSNEPGLELPDYSLSQGYQDQVWESASEGPSFALPDRNYESEPNMLTEYYNPRTMAQRVPMHGPRYYPWIPPSGNNLDNIASLDLANTQTRHPPFEIPGSIIPELDEESEPALEQAALCQMLSSHREPTIPDGSLAATGGSGVIQHHHHFHHHHYHHHYHH